jgi:anti-sigma regulatory factor (Ser/Thr protein kinase)
MTAQERQQLLRAEFVSPAQARSVVRRMLQLWDADADVEIAELLTSEVVTNAVRHAATEIMLRVLADESTVRVEVSGYGLHIVERLATRWGVDPAGANGKVVWFELSRGAGTDGASG